MARNVIGLRIEGKWYDLFAVPLEEVDESCLVQWRVLSEAGEPYTVAMHADGVATCDCADYEFRRRQADFTGCKHVKALRSFRLFGLVWHGEPTMMKGRASEAGD